MPGGRPILRVGLTGGIASGKSQVADFLAELGLFVIDADDITRQIMAPGGTAYDPVVAHFGREILDTDGRIERPTLARLVFHDTRQREALNAIVHPRVTAEVDRRITAYTRQGRSPIAVVDAALLVETGAFRNFHRLIVIGCTPQAQLQRLRERDGLSEVEAAARLEAQAPLAQKIAVADYVIDTDGSLERTRDQTRQVYARLLDDFEQEFRRPTRWPGRS